MKEFNKKLAAYSAAHFAVDLCCAYFVLSAVEGGDRVLYLLVYNFCAFALQMPLGAALDALKRNRLFAVSGMLLVGLGALLGKAPLALCVVVGTGNALFHIGGGREILCTGGGRSAYLGVFVSPGALGLFTGGLMAGTVPPAVPLIMLALTALAVILFCADTGEAVFEKEAVNGRKPVLTVLTAAALFAVVCIRSCGGGAFVFPWKTGTAQALVLTLALFGGKALGGVLADRFGSEKVSAVSLFLSALLFVFYGQPVCGVLAVFLFNMTMPITLAAVGRIMPERQGFGFGLLTFGLFVGALPAIFGAPAVMPMPSAGITACLLSAALLLLGLRGAGNIGR